ncbi:MAG TPA: S8 family peptidase [Candidatus Angelobacter sp.]|nr:S8 family peptidase [Candidatus Angelobacter sp.]
MRFDKVTLTRKIQGKRNWPSRMSRLFVATLLTLSTVAATAQHRKQSDHSHSAPGPWNPTGHFKKIAADLSNFTVNPDGTVNVIIQFKKAPQMENFAEMRAHGGRLKFNLYHIQGAAYRIPVNMLAWLENHPFVAYVTPDRPNHPAFDDAIPPVMGDLARQQFGMDGTGIGVAVIDSGVYNHPDLQSADGTTSRIVYSESFVPGDPSPNDAFGHGTHVAGIIAGNGRRSQSGYDRQYVGLAPNANIINLRVLDANGAGTDSEVIAAIQRAVELKDTYNIRVINLSLGRGIFESYTMDPLCQAVEYAWNSGIVVVVAAGNAGRDNSAGTDGYGTINAPGNDPTAITVGAANPHGTPDRSDDTIATFSSKGPTARDHVVKPDLVAPGNRIVSLESPGSFLATTYPTLAVTPLPICNGLGICTTPPGGQYLSMSGTSMATPVVAAAAALMIQNDISITPDTIKARMMKTAWKGFPGSTVTVAADGGTYTVLDDVFTVGAGYLDVDAAMRSTDVAQGSAASPLAVFNSTTGTAILVDSPPPIAGTSVVWDNSAMWGGSIVFGNGVTANSIIWNDGAIWSNPTIAGTSVVWDDSLIWDDSIIWSDSIVWDADIN